MLIRIVRMTFRPDNVDDFLEIFSQSQPLIRSFAGCLHLELLQDADNPVIYTTLSHWESVEALDVYRRSDLFCQTWAKTKLLFSEKPHAFSLLPFSF